MRSIALLLSAPKTIESLGCRTVRRIDRECVSEVTLGVVNGPLAFADHTQAMVGRGQPRVELDRT